MVFNALGWALRHAREREGLTPEALGKKIGVPGKEIGHWEAGKSFTKYMAEIEEILGPLSKKKDANEDADDTTEDEISGFGVWVHKARESLHLSVPELAKKAGIAPPTIYFIESGRIKNPQQSTRKKLYHVLGEPKELDSDEAQVEREEHEISGIGSLVDFNPSDKSDWPDCHGVYVLYDRSQRPVSVGSSKNSIKNRLKQHQEKFWFRSPIVKYGSYIEVADKNLREQLEQVMIKFLKATAVLNKRDTEGFDEE